MNKWGFLTVISSQGANDFSGTSRFRKLPQLYCAIRCLKVPVQKGDMILQFMFSTLIWKSIIHYCKWVFFTLDLFIFYDPDESLPNYSNKLQPWNAITHTSLFPVLPRRADITWFIFVICWISRCSCGDFHTGWITNADHKSSMI